MLDSKFFFTLVGLIVAVFAICNTNFSPAINEGFWGLPSRTIKIDRQVLTDPNNSCAGYSLQNNFQAMLGGEKFVSRPSLQSMLSPRMGGNVDYGANIRYNMPSYKNQAVPCDPMMIGDMAKDNYQENYQENYGCSSGNCGGGCSNGCGVPSCGKGGIPTGGLGSGGPHISADPNYMKAMDSVYAQSPFPSVTDSMPVGDMTTIGADGTVHNPVVIDRFIVANQKSWLRRFGDPIRGDLAIVPCKTGWFNVSVTPNIDLQEGAMNVMGGISNGTANAVAELNYATTAGAQQISAGVDMSSQFQEMLGAGYSDIQVSSFA